MAYDIGEFVHFEPTETHTLPVERKGWQGMPAAEIRLAPTPLGWLFATHSNTPMAGHGGPLGYWSKSSRVTAYATRDECFTAAVASLRRWVAGAQRHSGGNCKEARRIAAWCDALDVPALDLGAEPVRLADGVHAQSLVPGVVPVPATARAIAARQSEKMSKRGHAPMPSGGLFAPVQLDFFS